MIPVPASGPSNTLFPVFVKLENIQVLVVGGGAVGLEKLRALLFNAPQARVTLVATQICPEIRSLAATYEYLDLKERAFSPCDLLGKDLIIAATNDYDLHLQIRDMAKAQHILINVADTPELCDFYLGSIVSKGQVKIAISTNGKSPTVAKRLRELLSDLIPDEMDVLLERLGILRSRLKGDFAHKVRKLSELTEMLVREGEDKDKRKD